MKNHKQFILMGATLVLAQLGMSAAHAESDYGPAPTQTAEQKQAAEENAAKAKELFGNAWSGLKKAGTAIADSDAVTAAKKAGTGIINSEPVNAAKKAGSDVINSDAVASAKKTGSEVVNSDPVQALKKSGSSLLDGIKSGLNKGATMLKASTEASPETTPTTSPIQQESVTNANGEKLNANVNDMIGKIRKKAAPNSTTNNAKPTN